jgi:hypothetical protein
MNIHNFSKEEYLDLITNIADKQYSTLNDLDSQITPEYFHLLISNSVIDFSKVKSSQIKDTLFKGNNIKVYDFIIHINFFHGSPIKDGTNLTVDVSLFHEQHKTKLSGKPCKMMTPFNITKDDRFANRSWLFYFKGSHGKEIPIDILVEIIRWMQVVQKLAAFT